MSEFSIGISETGLVTLESLGIPDPMPDFIEHSQYLDAGDAHVFGMGFTLETWAWSFLEMAQRNTLKTYCAGTSSGVYIRTLKRDKTYANYKAIMIWKKETRRYDMVFDFSINFRLIEEL